MKHKLFFLSISRFFIVWESKAQILETNCLHYPYKTQLGINVNVNLLSKLQLRPNYAIMSSPSKYFRSYPSLGADFGVYFYQRLYKWFGIQIGAEYNVLTFRFGGTKDFGFDNIYMKYYALGSFGFPILFNASYYFSKRHDYFSEKHGIDISLGLVPWIRCGSSDDEGYTIRRDGYYSLDAYTLVFFGENPVFNFSLYMKIGYNFLFKNKNTLGVAIIGRYGIKPYAKGYCFIRKEEYLESKEEGVYTSLCNTYIGLQFSYGFTMKKRLCVP